MMVVDPTEVYVKEQEIFQHLSPCWNYVGLRMLQGMKATSTSYATTQAIHVDEAEFMHAGSMGFVLNDYPASGANNRHSSYPGGTG